MNTTRRAIALLGMCSVQPLQTAEVLPGMNQANNTTTNFGLPGDPDLNALIPQNTFDAAVLEFDFECEDLQVVTFQYVFSSEEYNEYVNTQFNDVFAFFVNGVNIALLPDGVTPVSINNVNCGNPVDDPTPSNCEFYINNSCQGPPGEPNVPFPCSVPNVISEMDGFTVVLTATAFINPGTNHMKLAIADAGDGAWDSAVFLQGGTFSCEPPAEFLGACCLPDGSCEVMTFEECEDVMGEFSLEESCDNVVCEVPSFCGDGVCDPAEDCDSCPEDCGICPFCGDGICDPDEDCENCPDDCGDCPSFCGDGFCDADEDCESCPQDCGDCPVPPCNPNAGDCCVSNISPGCEDIECCESICADDPFCCNVTWDRLCADAANETCAVCKDKPQDHEGCSIGFWKNHTHVWAGYSPDDIFDEVFSTSDLVNVFGSATLHQVISAPSGGPNALTDSPLDNNLGKQAVAAILNAASVNYPMTSDEVIEAVNEAYNSDDRDLKGALHAALDANNNFGCPEFETADLTYSGDVGIADLLALLANWGTEGPGDLDMNGVVGVPDLLILLSFWGPAQPYWQPN